MNGLSLCCRFSGITNKLNYCGPSKAYDVFYNFIRTGVGEEKVRYLLSRFEGLYPYLKFIGEKHNLDPFDYSVVEAYWLGNALLDSFNKEDYKSFLPELGKRGLPESCVEELQKNIPEGAIPHHTFHVLFVGVGKVTGSVPTNLENMRSCMASFGVVNEIGDSFLKIRGPVLEQKNGKFIFNELERLISFDKNMVNPVVGDYVAMHWGVCSLVLSHDQLVNLEKYTEKVIEVVNSVY